LRACVDGEIERLREKCFKCKYGYG